MLRHAANDLAGWTAISYEEDNTSTAHNGNTLLSIWSIPREIELLASYDVVILCVDIKSIVILFEMLMVMQIIESRICFPFSFIRNYSICSSLELNNVAVWLWFV